MDFTVQSLAFQEQDHEVAACATSALWTVLHATAELFQHTILSPVEITRSATSSWPLDSRALPNEGLDLFQMASVIRHVGLEPMVIDVKEQFMLQATIFAFLRGKIPVLMGINFNTADDGIPELHAIAVTGYELGFADPDVDFIDDFRLRATRMNVIYAHDDGVGPFSPICLERGSKHLSTGWSDNLGGFKKALAEDILVPLYPKIRIPLINILSVVIYFDATLEIIRNFSAWPLQERLEWAVFLSTIEDFKRELLEDKNIKPDLKASMLTKNMPRFLWRAIAFSSLEEKEIELIFDATDLIQGKMIIGTMNHNEAVAEQIGKYLNSADGAELMGNALTDSILRLYKDR